MSARYDDMEATIARVRQVARDLRAVTAERDTLRAALVKWKRNFRIDGVVRPLLDLVPDDEWGIE